MSLLSNVITPVKRLLVPSSVQPAFFCVTCPETFTEAEHAKFEDHIFRCSNEHFDELAAAHPFRQAPGFWTAADPEYEAWIKSPAGREWWDQASTSS